MKGQQQEPDAPVFGDKGAAVKNSTEVVNNAGFLQAIPALSSCTHDVLTEFIRDGATTVRCDAGETLATLTARDQNLYVLISGTAILRATDDVTITLEPGDYFGGNPNRRFQLFVSVGAVTDMEFMVISPRDVAQLVLASSRNRHPSKIEWRTELPTTTRRATRQSHRRSVLVSQGV